MVDMKMLEILILSRQRGSNLLSVGTKATGTAQGTQEK